MCGINGILGNSNNFNTLLVEKMNNSVLHRGPDDNRVEKYKGAIFGHVRLSIIDLDNRSSQPFISNDKKHVIVFNGEIYNYLELKKKLKSSYNFKTTSDTEVLLASYQKWGIRCLNEIIGMFAFCIYDIENQSAFFARDHYGQKPLYYSHKNNNFYFGSEIKSLISAGITPTPDLAIWHKYLVSAKYDDDENTFFQNIFQLMPGQMMTWKKGKIKKIFYHELKAKNSFKEITVVKNDVKKLLLSTSSLHMRSDVPVGLSLSGGLDSSTLLACLNSQGYLNKDFQCLSFIFKNHKSETNWINSAANYYNIQSNFLTYSQKDFINDLPSVMYHQEAPIGGLANCALSKLMSLSKKIGIKVILDGTGLDEAFGGYQNHHNFYLINKIKNDINNSDKYISEYSKFWDIKKKDIIKKILSQKNHSISSIDGSNPINKEILNNYFYNSYKLDSDYNNENYLNLYDHLIDYLKKSKIPRNTRMKDRASMAYSIELRLPFLEKNLIDYAMSIPEDIMFYKGMSKSIIREATKGMMDDNVRLAPKRSIQAPQGEWLRKSLMKNHITKIINSDSFADRGFFDISKLKNSYKEFNKGLFDNSFFIWQWINIDLWFKTFID